jgi:hypothetical protein
MGHSMVRWAGLLSIALLASLVASLAATARAQVAAPVLPVPKPAETMSDAAKPRMERFSGVWIDGPGYDIVYGGPYDVCAARCLATTACAMIEYYRPEKKCNMYKAPRPRLQGGSSDVAIKR